MEYFILLLFPYNLKRFFIEDDIPLKINVFHPPKNLPVIPHLLSFHLFASKFPGNFGLLYFGRVQGNLSK